MFFENATHVATGAEEATVLAGALAATDVVSEHALSMGDAAAAVLRAARSVLVRPAPGYNDTVPNGFNPFRLPSGGDAQYRAGQHVTLSDHLGGVPHGSTYWHHRDVVILSTVVVFALWALAIFVYHARHVLRRPNAAERVALRAHNKALRTKAREERRRMPTLMKRLGHGGVIEDDHTDASSDTTAASSSDASDANASSGGRTAGASTAVAQCCSAGNGIGGRPRPTGELTRERRRRERQRRRDARGEELVDYDPWGRPVPKPPMVPLVGWMTLYSLAYSVAFHWVGAASILLGQLLPVASCLIVVFCVVIPE
jgi:hypothetical protein